MGKHNFLKKAALATLIVAPLLITAPTLAPTAHAYETNPNGYEVPDLTGYKKLGQVWMDIDDDGKKETKFVIYRNGGGNYITKYIIKDRVWAWGIIKDLNAGDGYAIVDNDCDGSFEHKYIGDEDFDVPACLK